MLNKIKMPYVLLATATAFTTTTHAKEVSLERIVNQIFSQSIASVQQELNREIQGAVLTASNEAGVYEEKTYIGRVTITDLDSSDKTVVKSKSEE